MSVLTENRKPTGTRPGVLCVAIAVSLASETVCANLTYVPHDPAVGSPWRSDFLAMLRGENPSRSPFVSPTKISLLHRSIEGERIVVKNCADSGQGSLRDALGLANTGDTVDMSNLACGVITLTSGALTVTQDTISLRGPGPDLLTLSGSDSHTVLTHSGTGTLAMDGLAISHGFNRQPIAYGGCIYSHGHLSLQNVHVHDCVAEGYGDGGGAVGGGLFSGLGADLTNSSVVANRAYVDGESIFDTGSGGGIVSFGHISLLRSYVGNNSADGCCGGIGGTYGFRSRFSTIAGNRAPAAAGLSLTAGVSEDSAIDIEATAILDNVGDDSGGLWLYGARPPAPQMVLINSTVSGNIARATGAGGIYVRYGNLEIANSTIAFNGAGAGEGVGLTAVRASVRLDSSIVANNITYYGTDIFRVADLDGFQSTIDGGHNLITVSNIQVPPDTISDDPMLVA